MRRRIAVWLVAVAVMGGCSSAPGGHAGSAPTTSTVAALRQGESRVIASGVLDGVKWRFVEQLLGQLRCRGYAFTPPVPTPTLRLPPSLAERVGPNYLYVKACGRPAGWGKLDAPILQMASGVGADHSFSVFAAEVAPGITKVVIHYPRGVDATVPVSGNHILDVERPPRPEPTALSLDVGSTPHTCQSSTYGQPQPIAPVSDQWFCK